MTSFVDETVIRALLREYHPHLTEEQLCDAEHAIAQEVEVTTYDRIRHWDKFPRIRVLRRSSSYSDYQRR